MDESKEHLKYPCSFQLFLPLQNSNDQESMRSYFVFSRGLLWHSQLLVALSL